MKIDWKSKWQSINARTKVFIGLAFTYILSVNVPEVKNYIIPKLANHPHLSSTIGGALVIISLIQNPMVRDALGIKQENTVEHGADGTTTTSKTTSVVPIDPGTTVDASTSTVKTSV